MAKKFELDETAFNEAFEEGKTVAVTAQEPIKAGSPVVLAVVDDGKRSKLMLHELKDRGIKFTEQKADLKNVKKSVLDLVKDKKDNVIVYLPVTNTDFNKNSKEYSELRAEAGVPVNYYFDGHDDQEISNRCFRLKIE